MTTANIILANKIINSFLSISMIKIVKTTANKLLPLIQTGDIPNLAIEIRK